MERGGENRPAAWAGPAAWASGEEGERAWAEVWAAGREVGLGWEVGFGLGSSFFFLSISISISILLLSKSNSNKLKPNEFKSKFEFTRALKQLKQCSSMMQQRN